MASWLETALPWLCDTKRGSRWGDITDCQAVAVEGQLAINKVQRSHWKELSVLVLSVFV